MKEELGPVEREALALLVARRKKGREEYGVGIEDSTLTVEELLDYALEEAVDQLIYLLALRRRRIDGWKRLAAAIKEVDDV